MQYLIQYVYEGNQKGYIISKPKANSNAAISDQMVWPTLLKCLQHIAALHNNLWPITPIPLQKAYETDIAHFAYLAQLESPDFPLPPHWLYPQVNP
ncbi:MAG: hypothetical protein ACOVMN_11540 [Flexibacteraceae bacterium]